MRRPVKYVPAWFPGGGFQRTALYARQLAWNMRYVPFGALKAQLVSVWSHNRIATIIYRHEWF